MRRLDQGARTIDQPANPDIGEIGGTSKLGRRLVKRSSKQSKTMNPVVAIHRDDALFNPFLLLRA
ncbi:MAG: hypothetical protein ABI589_09760 [Burkholderiales bacterium]